MALVIKPEFALQDPHSGRRKWAPLASCPLPSAFYVHTVACVALTCK